MSHYPRSSTELYAGCLHLSLKQREVLEALSAFPNGAKASEVAQRLDMHVNTARGHLDELIAAGVVRAATAARTGRGRPSLIFHVRIPDNRTVAKEYLTLIELMVEMLSTKGTVGEDELKQARNIGRRWAQETVRYHPVENPEPGVASSSPREFLLSKMRDMGFDPVLGEGNPAGEKSAGGNPAGRIKASRNTAGSRNQDIALHACPFVTDNNSPSSFVCAVHAGFLAEVSRTVYQGKTLLKLFPSSRSGACLIREEDGA